MQNTEEKGLMMNKKDVATFFAWAALGCATSTLVYSLIFNENVNPAAVDKPSSHHEELERTSDPESIVISTKEGEAPPYTRLTP